ncbi:MAG: NCS2 family permease [Candidatus Hydrogenedentota bacterium]|nr:MAG: NCS2 family permease [Candidatus Hydrogenedentota bacterium]
MSRTIRNFFALDHLGSDIKTETLAGLTTFLTMSYIIVVNPAILSQSGLPASGALTATILVSALSSILMGLIANLPFALAPGMGLNAFFTYSLVLGRGLPWQSALGAVVLSGILFLFLTLFNVREMVVKTIPGNLRHALACGIGLFLALIGLEKAGFVVDHPATLVTHGDFTSPSVLLFLFGFFLTAALLAYRFRGAILIGIIITTAAALPAGQATLPQHLLARPDFSTAFLHFRFSNLFVPAMIGPLFTLLFTDLFDSLSTFVGVAEASDLLDSDGQPRNLRKALFVDAIATLSAGLFGSSSGTTYIESAAGVQQGGRSGLTAVVAGLCFLPFLFAAPLAAAIPDCATAPALVLIGIFMFRNIRNMHLENWEDGVPAFLAVVLIPLTYSITQGIVWGFLSHTLMRILRGRANEIPPMLWVLSFLSILALLF